MANKKRDSRAAWCDGFVEPVRVYRDGRLEQCGRELPVHINKGGGYAYTHVRSYRPDGTTYGKTYSVHKLVALAWHGRTDEECDHINRNRSDNRPENLRWLSHRDNCNREETRSAIRRGHVYRPKAHGKVWATAADGVIVACSSVKEAALLAGTKPNVVYNILAGKYGWRTSHGWTFVEYTGDRESA